MKKIWLLSFLFIFTFSQKISATPVDVIKPKTPTEESVQAKKKKKKKRFFARLTERIMKKRVGKMIKKLGLDPKGCDRIIKTDGEELEVVIVKIGPERIRYKSCDFQNGPTRSIRKEDIFMIKYEDGTKEIITDIEALRKNQQEVINTYESDQSDENYGEYWAIGFILGIFLGLFGVLIVALAFSGKKRKRALQGSLVGIISMLILTIALIALLIPFI